MLCPTPYQNCSRKHSITICILVSIWPAIAQALGWTWRRSKGAALLLQPDRTTCAGNKKGVWHCNRKALALYHTCGQHPHDDLAGRDVGELKGAAVALAAQAGVVHSHAATQRANAQPRA